MGEIIRSDVNEDWAHSGIVEAGDFVTLAFVSGMLASLLKSWLANLEVVPSFP